MQMRVGMGFFKSQIGLRVSPGEGLGGKVWQSEALLRIDDYRACSGRLVGKSFDSLRSIIGIPLKFQGRVEGVIGLAHVETGKDATTILIKAGEYLRPINYPESTVLQALLDQLPQLDPASRTQRARIVLDNRDGLLAPGMFPQIRLDSTGKQDAVLVPTDALIGGGNDTRAIVQDAQGRFVPVAVRTGDSSGGMTEVLSGLKGGERVVASGQFLIDSEASLSGALGRLGRQPETHQHPMPDAPGAAEPVPKTPTDQSGRPVLYWYDPMVPDKHFDKPGKSPYMDMPLVPRYADEEEAKP